MSRHSLTLPVGTTMQSRAHVTTDSDRDRYLATAYAHDTAGAITRPSGEPRPLQASSADPGGWSGRQQAAMRKLRRLWDEAKIERVQPQGYPSEVCKPYTPAGEDIYTQEQVEAAVKAYREYQRAMDDVRRRCSERHAYWLRQAVHGEAVPLGATHLTREALGWLADEWRLK